MKKFDSGVLVIQLASHSEEEIIDKTSCQVEEAGSLTSEELSQLLNMAITLARERYCALFMVKVKLYNERINCSLCEKISQKDLFLIAVHLFFRLLLTEQAGKLCRDDSLEGLRFYPNRFLAMDS